MRLMGYSWDINGGSNRRLTNDWIWLECLSQLRCGTVRYSLQNRGKDLASRTLLHNPWRACSRNEHIGIEWNMLESKPSHTGCPPPLWLTGALLCCQCVRWTMHVSLRSWSVQMNCRIPRGCMQVMFPFIYCATCKLEKKLTKLACSFLKREQGKNLKLSPVPPWQSSPRDPETAYQLKVSSLNQLSLTKYWFVWKWEATSKWLNSTGEKWSIFRQTHIAINIT